MRLLLVLLSCLLITSYLHAQELRGRVFDATTRQPLAGVQIQLTPSPYGTLTDSLGYFVLRNLPPERYTLVARYVGYRTFQQAVSLSRTSSIELQIQLEPQIIELQAVTVSASREEETHLRPSLIALTPRETRTLAGGVEDVLRSLQALPGVLAPSDFSAQLIVRGGGPDENLILIDGLEVFNPYRLYGVVSMFNPATVQNIRLFTGGFPARYGDRLSSVVDVRLRQGNHERILLGSINTSIVSAGATVEGKTGLLDGSYWIAGRRTYYDLILGLLARRLNALSEEVRFPNFTDIQGKITLRPASRHQVELLGIWSKDALDIAFEGDISKRASPADRFRAQDLTYNRAVGIQWRWSPYKNLTLVSRINRYLNNGTFGSDGRLVPRDRLQGNQIVASTDTSQVFEFSYTQSFSFAKSSLAQEVHWKYANHLLEAGIGIDWLRNTIRYQLELNDVGRAYVEAMQQNPQGHGAFPYKLQTSESYYRYALFVQDEITLLNQRLRLQPGIRYQHYRLLEKGYLAPRFQLMYNLNPITSLRLAWGLYYQSPGYEKLIDSDQIFDLSEGIDARRLEAEQATHYIAGISRWLSEKYRLSVEAYLKTFDNLLVQQRGPVSRYEAVYIGGPRSDPHSYRLERVTTTGLLPVPVNEARGKAYGVEILLEKKYHQKDDRLTGWIAYAYSRAYRIRPSIEHPGEVLKTPFDYDRPHVLNVVLNYRLGKKWKIGLTWRYGTGFPYTPGLRPEPLVVLRVDPTDPLAPPQPEILTNEQTGFVRFTVDYGDERNINSARLPDYHRLDVRLTRKTRWFGLDGEAYLDIINVYNRKNILAYRFRAIVNEQDPGHAPLLVAERVRMFPLLPTLGFSLTF